MHLKFSRDLLLIQSLASNCYVQFSYQALLDSWPHDNPIKAYMIEGNKWSSPITNSKIFLPCPTFSGNIMPRCQEDNGNRHKNEGWKEMRHKTYVLKWVWISLENIQGTWEATVEIIDDKPGLLEGARGSDICTTLGQKLTWFVHQPCRHGWNMSCTEVHNCLASSVIKNH